MSDAPIDKREQARQDFSDSLRTFNNAAFLLMEAEWPDNDMPEGYPFPDSFEEVVVNISTWYQRVKAKFPPSSASGPRPTPSDFVRMVGVLSDSAYNLLIAWETLSRESPVDEAEMSDGYPFKKSLDDLVHEILDWKEQVSR